MDISPIVDSEFESVDLSTTVASARGRFEDPRRKALLITRDDDLVGIVTRKDILSSHEHHEQKVRNLYRPVPSIGPTASVREVSRLMLAADIRELPVEEDGDVIGVVTADELLLYVAEHLDILDATTVASTDLITIDATTGLGRTIALFRENSVQHLPVVDAEQGTIVGIASLYDILSFVTRALHRSQGGEPDNEHGAAAGAHHGGFGAREGESDDLLSLPVRNVMVSPVVTLTPEHSAEEVVREMSEYGASSVVLTEGDIPRGIVTKTDLLEALSITEEVSANIQIFGIDQMQEISREKVADQIERITGKDRELTLYEGKIHFHRHKEQLRGRPLVLVRIRLFTDKGLFTASAEGFGDRHAFSLAVESVERQIIDTKERMLDDSRLNYQFNE